ncbi:hypothetical protein C9374_014575 [Naegleria lovaniensis]|uniref:Glycosyltransferase n=1 Tax=Naegleria lovaniensis TaxID=51637 RepID=A0AA88GY46_NAELO|nr:uncharacterized protein C9374_014575 [Naegleria lovaniensis]KAG2389175.1 hypothetical protein C9374_014575 [Naegleria lovaniensis]
MYWDPYNLLYAKMYKFVVIGGLLFVLSCFSMLVLFSSTRKNQVMNVFIPHSVAANDCHSSMRGASTHQVQDDDEQVALESTQTPPPLSLFYSSYQCNKYQEGIGHSVPDIYPKHTLFAQCSFQNLCLNRRGQWVLFLDNDTAPTSEWISRVNEQVWVYTQPRVHSSRGDMIIKVYGDGPVQLVSTSKTGSSKSSVDSNNIKNNNYEKPTRPRAMINLSPDFKYISSPSFLTHRYVAGNVGHVLMDGMTEAMINMVMFKLQEYTEMNIVFLEDIHDDSYHSENWVAAYNYDKNMSDKYSIDFFGLMSNKPVLQKCSTSTGWTVTKAPCRNQIPTTINEDNKDELTVCFKNAIAGMSRPYLLSAIGAEVINEPLRTLVSKVTGINFEYKASTKQEIVVAIHNKPKQGRHGEIIWNFEEVYSMIAERLPKEEFIVNVLKKKVRVVDLHLEGMNARQQVQFFSQVDVYIVDQGSASYMTMFLPRNAIVIQAPDCRYREDKSKFCYDRFSQYAYTFSHVKMYPFLSLLPSSMKTIDCNPRPTAEETNCDPILPPEVTYNAVVSTLTERFKELLYRKY